MRYPWASSQVSAPPLAIHLHIAAPAPEPHPAGGESRSHGKNPEPASASASMLPRLRTPTAPVTEPTSVPRALTTSFVCCSNYSPIVRPRSSTMFCQSPGRSSRSDKKYFQRQEHGVPCLGCPWCWAWLRVLGKISGSGCAPGNDQP